MSKKGKRRTFANLVDVNVRDFEISNTLEFDTYVEQFLAHTTSKNRSSHTVSFYKDKLHVWRITLEELGLPTEVTNITQETIEVFSDYLIRKKGWKYSSVSNVLRAVKAFANYLQKNGVLASHGFEEFVIGKGKQNPIETFSEAQIIRLLQQTDPRKFVGVRDYLIMLTFLETGIRLRELVDLDVLDVDLNERVLKVFGKNQSYRYVPFQSKYAKLMRQYLKVRGESDTDALFVSQDDGRLRARSIQDNLRKYGKRANITNVRVSPHTFRHTFAKMYVKNGGDPFSLQSILGHSTMDMVRTYVNMFGKELDEAHRKFSPLKNIFK